MSIDLATALHRISPLSPPVEARVVAAFLPRTLAPGERLSSGGEVCGGIAFVEQGLLVSKSIETTREASCDLFAEGDFATDYVSVLTGQPSSVDIIALEPCALRWLPSDALQQLYGISAEAERLGRRIVELQFVSLAQRTIALLSESPEERYRRLAATRPDLLQRVPQHVLARWVGVTPESLSRIRQRLVAQRSATRTTPVAGKSKAPSAKAGGPKSPRAPREKP